MELKIFDYFLMFMIYSFIGWSIEVIRGIHQNKRFINRGFLMGPYCPIYGVGCLAIVIFLNSYYKEPIALFALTLVLCSALEYVTSYIMEKIFKTRWWDYSNRKYNINGRICLETMIPFGICGMIVIYIANPLLNLILKKIPITIKIWIAIPILIFFIIDFIVSFKIINEIKNVIKLENKDATEEIRKKVKKIISSGNKKYKRLLDSFPYIKSQNKKS